MNPRINYEMTEDDFEELLDACKPVPAMLIGGVSPSSPQENANRAWKSLGEKMGFDHMTVNPVNGKGTRFFTAVSSENEKQKQEREDREQKEKRISEINRIKHEIEKLEQELKNL